MKLAATNFTQNIIKQSAIVYDLRVNLNNEDRYFIIRIEPAKRTAFLNAVKKDSGFRLEDFGEILHRGWNEPDDELKAQLREQFRMYVE